MLPYNYNALNAILNGFGGWAGFPPVSFDLGDRSDGNVTISTNTYLTATGPVVVKNYNNLTVNTGCALGVSAACQGLVLKIAGTFTLTGYISMQTYWGSYRADTHYQYKKYLPPQKVWGNINDKFAYENGLLQTPSMLTYSIPAAGAALGAGAASRAAGGTTTNVGYAGTAGTAGTGGKCGGGGGGGSGGAWSTSGAGGNGAAGNAGGGGGGGGGSGGAYGSGSQAGGAASGCEKGTGSAGTGGYGAGGAGGKGGGIVVVICDTLVGSGGGIYASGEDGVVGVSTTGAGGGGGGGGSILVLYRTLTSALASVFANGGAGATATSYGGKGGNGGAGSIVQAQFTYS